MRAVVSARVFFGSSELAATNLTIEAGEAEGLAFRLSHSCDRFQEAEGAAHLDILAGTL